MATIVRPDPTIPTWCEIGDAVQPIVDDIKLGWPPSQIPPSRQEFNWLDKRQDENIRYLCRVGVAEYSNAESYQGFGLVIGSNGSIYWNLRTCQGIDPVYDNQGYWEPTMIRLRDADARYLKIVDAAALYLTQAQGDARYQLKVDMAPFATWAGGDLRWALKGDLAPFETAAHAAATYLRIADAATTYLSQSAAAQLYITIADANGRFALKTDLAPLETSAHASATYLKMSDAANMYLLQNAAAQIYMTIANANATFAYKGDLAPFETSAHAVATYLKISDAAALYLTQQVAAQTYETIADVNARFALKSDLNPFLKSGDAAATYLRIVDAANTYLTQSAAGQIYLAISDANTRFANTTADAHNYTDASVNNLNAALRAWVPSLLPGMVFSSDAFAAGTMTANWFKLRGTPNAAGSGGFEFAWGTGEAQEGDYVTVPAGFAVGNMIFGASLEWVMGQYTPGDALLNMEIRMNGNYLQNCHYAKSNDNHTWRGRGNCGARWWGFGIRGA